MRIILRKLKEIVYIDIGRYVFYDNGINTHPGIAKHSTQLSPAAGMLPGIFLLF